MPPPLALPCSPGASSAHRPFSVTSCNLCATSLLLRPLGKATILEGTDGLHSLDPYPNYYWRKSIQTLVVAVKRSSGGPRMLPEELSLPLRSPLPQLRASLSVLKPPTAPHVQLMTANRSHQVEAAPPSVTKLVRLQPCLAPRFLLLWRGGGAASTCNIGPSSPVLPAGLYLTGFLCPLHLQGLPLSLLDLSDPCEMCPSLYFPKGNTK